MADTPVAVTYSFSANTTIASGQVNTNFSDLVTFINNKNSASSTWDALWATSADRVPLIVNNSTGANQIAQFKHNGTVVVEIDHEGGIDLSGSATPAAGSVLADVCYKESLVKAFFIMDGTGTPAYGSYFNMTTSITDNGTGDYTLTIDRDFASANYVIVGNARSASSDTTGIVCIQGVGGNPAAGTIRIFVTSIAAAYDSNYICVMFAGKQS